MASDEEVRAVEVAFPELTNEQVRDVAEAMSTIRVARTSVEQLRHRFQPNILGFAPVVGEMNVLKLEIEALERWID